MGLGNRNETVENSKGMVRLNGAKEPSKFIIDVCQFISMSVNVSSGNVSDRIEQHGYSSPVVLVSESEKNCWSYPCSR